MDHQSSRCTVMAFAIAYRAGVKLKDLEFISFPSYCTQKKTRHLFCFSQKRSVVKGTIINSKHDRLCPNTFSAELAPRM